MTEENPVLVDVSDGVGVITLNRAPRMNAVSRALATGLFDALAALEDNIEGDFVEAGVFKGGTSIVMMHVLDRARSEKRHWACDGFQGIPELSKQDKVKVMVGQLCLGQAGSPNRSAVCNRPHNLRVGAGKWKSSRDAFEENVRTFGVKRNRLHVVPGWFSDSLPPTGLRRIAFLRLDGDLYNSTRDALVGLEPLVSRGGYIYVDDYGSYRGCALAVDEYRAKHGITARMHPIVAGVHRKFQALWWRKE